MTAGAISITARGIRKSFHGGFTVDVPLLNVRAGQTLALLGPSGAGKSTLLWMLGLLEKPDAGQVLLDDHPVSPHDRTARRAMAAVFQRPYLFKDTVDQNVAYGLRLRGFDAAERRERVGRALDRVGLAGYENRAALTLSGGEAQRVSLARALVLEPRVLLLDEPLASLDALLKSRLSEEFARILASTGVTTVYVTHDHNEALVVADRIAIMNDGRVVSEGPVDQVMSVPGDEWTARFLGVEPSLEGVVRASGDGLVTVACGADEIFAIGEATPGDRVLVGVRPEDVMLFASAEEMPLSSARNRLEGKVASLSPRGATWHVTVASDSVRIVASVSRASLRDLELAEGSPVTAVFKATAVRMRPAASGD